MYVPLLNRLTRLFSVTVLLLAFIGCSSGEAAPASSPDEAVERVAHAVADGRLEVAWQALPESYQQEITDLVHEAAEKTDAELWNRSFVVLSKLSRVLSEKREFILQHPNVAAQLDDPEKVERSWDAVVGIFDVFVNSDLADLEKIERLDIEAFLAETGSDMMAHVDSIFELAEKYGQPGDPLARLRDADATVLSSSGDVATLRIQIPGTPDREEDYIRIEGKWISKELADRWSESMAKAREQLAAYTGEESEQDRQMVLMQLTMVEGVLDGVLATRTADEFNAKIGAAMGMAFQAMMAYNAAKISPTAGALSPSGAGVSGQMPREARPGVGENTVKNRPARAVSPAGAPLIPTTPGIERVELTEIDRYIGKRMQVNGPNGFEMLGKLTEAREDSLVFEREVAGGTMSFELDKRDISTIDLVL